MSETLIRVQRLAEAGDLRVSAHGMMELDKDDLYPPDMIAGLQNAIVVEDYPNHPRGPCVLVLQRDRNRQAVHVLWGIPRYDTRPAVLITGYRPDPVRWSNDFTKRQRR
jgi:hypothetical protein